MTVTPETDRYRMTGDLFRAGHVTLASGEAATWKIDCDALTPNDWAGLALIAVETFGAPGSVTGVPRGGLPFAHALVPHLRADSTICWVVDDVVTTGTSMVKHWAAVGSARRCTGVIGVAAFSRGSHPDWVHALFTGPAPRQADAIEKGEHRG